MNLIGIQSSIFLIIMTLGLSNIASGQVALKDTKFIPNTFEVSASYSKLQIFVNDIGTDNRYRNGFSLKAGYWPDSANRKLLIETYLIHIPKSKDPLEPAPQINSVGVSLNYLILSPSIRINPFLGLGFGIYKIDDNDPGVSPESSSYYEPFFEDETITTLVTNSGFYISISPEIALRADVRLYNPIGSNYERLENGKSRFEFATGLIFRF